MKASIIRLFQHFRVAPTTTSSYRPRCKPRIECLEWRDVPAATGVALDVDLKAPDFESSRVLVRWRDGVAHTDLNFTQVESLGNGFFRATLNPTVSVVDAVKGLRHQSSVASVQPDYRVHTANVPNDADFGNSWGLNNTGQDAGLADADIDAPEAWDVSTGTRHTVVAVVDTGIEYRDPDLTANVWVNPGEIAGNGIDDDGNGYVDDVNGWDFIHNSPNVLDDNGHGTHVAGTIGAVGNNGIGTTGVNWNTQLMALKFLDSDGGGNTSDAILALNYAAANGAKVINNSWGGGPNYDPALADAIKSLRSLGVIVVCAAGNDKTNTDFIPNYPSGYAEDNVISVAATDRNDKLAVFSNFGKNTADIAAPGVDVYSTVLANRYAYYSGTSMATPHVAGAASLIWDAHPTWTYRQVIEAMLQTADRLPVLNGKVGTGRLNLDKAIRFDPSSVPPTSPEVLGPTVTGVEFIGKLPGINTARITFSKPIDAKTLDLTDATLLDPNGKNVRIRVIKPSFVFDYDTSDGVQQFDAVFPGRALPGIYTLTFGPDIRDLDGNAMDENRNGVTGEIADNYTTTHFVPSFKTVSSGSLHIDVPDLGQATSIIQVNNDITIRDLDVRISLKHNSSSDCRLTLTAPNGTSITLFHEFYEFFAQFNGRMKNAIFDDDTSRQMDNGLFTFGPFTGRYAPEEPLAVFDGMDAKGTWTLLVEDKMKYDEGTLTNWALLIGRAPADLKAKPAGNNRISAPPTTVGTAPAPDVRGVFVNTPVLSPIAESSEPAPFNVRDRQIQTLSPAVPNAAADWQPKAKTTALNFADDQALRMDRDEPTSGSNPILVDAQAWL